MAREKLRKRSAASVAASAGEQADEQQRAERQLDERQDARECGSGAGGQDVVVGDGLSRAVAVDELGDAGDDEQRAEHEPEHELGVGLAEGVEEVSHAMTSFLATDEH